MQQRRRPVALPGGYGEQHNVASLSVGEHPSATDERVGVQEPARTGKQQASGQVSGRVRIVGIAEKSNSLAS